MNTNKIDARVTILNEWLDPKNNKMVDLHQFYGEWYSFDGKELDVSIVKSHLPESERKEKPSSYYYKLPNGSMKLIPMAHCNVVHEFI